MGTKEALHELVDSLSEEDAEELLNIASWSFGEPEPFTDEDVASIQRGLDDAAAGRVFTTDEVLRHVKHP